MIGAEGGSRTDHPDDEELGAMTIPARSMRTGLPPPVRRQPLGRCFS
jgi:hypothetical protein